MVSLSLWPGTACAAIPSSAVHASRKWSSVSATASRLRSSGGNWVGCVCTAVRRAGSGSLPPVWSGLPSRAVRARRCGAARIGWAPVTQQTRAGANSQGQSGRGSPLRPQRRSNHSSSNGKPDSASSPGCIRANCGSDESAGAGRALQADLNHAGDHSLAGTPDTQRPGALRRALQDSSEATPGAVLVALEPVSGPFPSLHRDRWLEHCARGSCCSFLLWRNPCRLLSSRHSN